MQWTHSTRSNVNSPANHVRCSLLIFILFVILEELAVVLKQMCPMFCSNVVGSVLVLADTELGFWM